MQLLLINARDVVEHEFVGIERVALGSNLTRRTKFFVFVIIISRLLVHTAPISASNLCADAAVAGSCICGSRRVGRALVQYLVLPLEKKCMFCPLGGTILGKLLFALYISTKKVARGITTMPPAGDFIAKSPKWPLKSQKTKQTKNPGAGQKEVEPDPTPLEPKWGVQGLSGSNMKYRARPAP
jgi:hypothetical protein